MNLDLSEEQLILKKAARDFLEKECPPSLVKEVREGTKGFLPELWSKVAEMGWPGLVFPGQYDGMEGSFSDFIVLLEETGRALLPLPLAQTVSAGLVILKAGNEGLKAKFLSRVSNGKLLAAPAIAEEDGDYNAAYILTKAVRSGDEYIITGSKHFVPFGPEMDLLLVAARTGEGPADEGITLFAVNAKDPAIKYEVQKSSTGMRVYKAALNGVRTGAGDILGEAGNGWEAVNYMLVRDGIAQAAMQLGSAERALELTVEIAKTRVQFGKPIGTFQAVQQVAADMLIDIDGMKYTVYHAAGLVDEGTECSREAAIARIWADTAYKRTAVAAVKLHGAIGFTRDHDVGLHLLNAIDEELPYRFGDYYRRSLIEIIKTA